MANAQTAPRGGASGFKRRPGVREMKEYPLTSRELWTLGGIQVSSAFALSFAGWLFGFWLNAKQAIDFAKKGPTDPAILGQWQGYADMAFYGAVGLGALGLLLIAITGLNVISILKDTTHA